MKKIIAAICAILLIVAAALGYGWLRDNKMPNFYGEADLYVRPGDTPDSVVNQLRGKLKILSERSLLRVFGRKEVAAYITPGHYVVNGSCSSVYVARMLNNGWQTPVQLTLSGSLRTKGEIARKIGNQLMLDSLDVALALADRPLLAAYGATPENVFPAFWAATYDIYWTASMEDVLRKCAAASESFWTAENKKKAAAVGLNPKKSFILASIVKGESRYLPELPKIAGVYLNRLDRGMRLQADPTVAYCFDYEPRRILYKHLEVDSPYNTYKYAGLPPGPINVPDVEYLRAVLNPDYGGGNLFFCASPEFDGSHRFARTISEHNRNANAFRVARKNSQ